MDRDDYTVVVALATAVVLLVILFFLSKKENEEHPCIRYQYSTCSQFMMVGKVLVPMQIPCNRCVERK